MKKIVEERKVLEWNIPGFGLFQATLWDGKLTDFRCCESGSLTSICTSNVKFLEAVRDSITDLLKEIEIK